MEQPHAEVERVHDSHNVNMLCAISLCKVHGLFFFGEPTVTGINYPDMLYLLLMPQLQENSEDYIVQQGKAPPHSHLDICAHLIANLPSHWIRRTSANNSLLPWPPR
jgi:hypothetical protein